MKKAKIIPQLRFSEFDDDWEEKKLNNYLEVSTEKNFDNLFTKENVLSVSGEFGVVNQIAFQGRSFAGASLTNYKISDLESVIYTKSPLNATPYGIIKANKFEKGIVSVLYAVYKTNNSDSKFIQDYFNLDERLNNYLRPLISKGAKNTINVSDLEALEGIVTFPSLSEQQKIGTFLSHVDSLIQAKTKKLESLKAVKKSLLQKCFPRAGEKVPEMRFAGFSGEWEEKKLGEIAVFSKGHGYSKNDLIPDGDPIILYGRMYINYETVISNIETFVHKQENSVLSKGGEIIIPASGETAEDIARASVVEKKGIILGGDINIVSLPKSVYDSSFVTLSVSHGESQKELCQNAQGKTIVHLHNDDIRKISILFPSLTEQQKIGQFFSKYDSIISAQQKEINKLKDIKKSLLQKMFV